ncbi:MAG TPA: hypothetical protein VGB97_04385 [Candidatus Paceibacterota bacterium]
MKMKGLGLMAAGIVLFVCGFVLLKERAVEAPEAPAAALRTFSWRFETKESASDDGSPPRTHVTLFTGGAAYDLGNYAGSCAEMTAEQFLPGEEAGVLCWWAGAGDEIGIFKEDKGYVVKLGLQEEGTAESPGFRGDFIELVVLGDE